MQKSGFKESKRGVIDSLEIGGKYLQVILMDIGKGEQCSPPNDDEHQGYFLDGTKWTEPITGPRCFSIEQWRDGPRDEDGRKRVTVVLNEEACGCESCEGRRTVFSRPLTSDDEQMIGHLLRLIASSLTLGMIGPSKTDPQGDPCPEGTRAITASLLMQALIAAGDALPWVGEPPTSYTEFQERVRCIATVEAGTPHMKRDEPEGDGKPWEVN